MADQSDVEVALVQLCQAALAPTQDTTARVYRGWPPSGGLTADLALGVSHVSIFPQPGSSRNTTRWAVRQWSAPSVPALQISVQSFQATFSGAIAIGQVAGLLVDGVPFSYRTVATDDLASVVSALGRQVQTVFPCAIGTDTLTFSGASLVAGRVVQDCPTVTEIGRQQQSFRISVWSPGPVVRDRIAGTLLPAIMQTEFLGLADGSGGRLRYRATANDDSERDASLFRRDTMVDVEYATTVSTSLPEMLFGDLLSGNAQHYV